MHGSLIIINHRGKAHENNIDVDSIDNRNNRNYCRTCNCLRSTCRRFLHRDSINAFLTKETTMIKIKQVASNMIVIYRDGSEILFSYQTPVAVYDRNRGEYLRTEAKFSQTTSRHINKWLEGVKAIPVPQHTIEEYVR